MEKLADIITRLEAGVETMKTDARPALVQACFSDVALALRILAAGNPSGVLESTEE
jgi:hypothetical protein